MVENAPAGPVHHYAGEITDNRSVKLQEVTCEEIHRLPTFHPELDRVLGGGLVPGMVVLLGGDPGIGKSTLLLQLVHDFGKKHGVLYVSGEESLQQIALRAKRLQLEGSQLSLLAQTELERILQAARSQSPDCLVIDSIQTMFSQEMTQAPGSVSQVRACAGQLVQFAKQNNTIVFLIGHVTKEGAIAGPRVLEHMVDTVLYFEGDTHSRFRLLRAVKNRFGAVNELGIFGMTDTGLRAVSNPSALFLSDREAKPLAGSAIGILWEGSRALLVEVQALLDTAHGQPKRLALGFDGNRLAMLLAVLHRHAGVATFDQDVFGSLVGGLKSQETALDLTLLAAIFSSLKQRPLDRRTIVLGEVGLAGEIRPIARGPERLAAAIQHGFEKVILPKANCQKKMSGIIQQPIGHLSELSSLLF